MEDLKLYGAARLEGHSAAEDSHGKANELFPLRAAGVADTSVPRPALVGPVAVGAVVAEHRKRRGWFDPVVALPTGHVRRQDPGKEAEGVDAGALLERVFTARRRTTAH